MTDAKAFHGLAAETIEAIEAIRRMAARGTSDGGLDVAPDHEDKEDEDEDDEDDDDDDDEDDDEDDDDEEEEDEAEDEADETP